MINVRRSSARGHANHGWLDSFFSFSFADYHDPRFMGFRDLRVINEDRVEPSRGFGTHPHRDMEIITYVVGGALEHRDSMGNGSVMRRGDVQRMSAGTGVTHSEFNPSPTEPVHLLQIWILPERAGIEPSYEQRNFSEAERTDRWRRVAGPDAGDGAVLVHQQVSLYATLLSNGATVDHALAAGRHAWVQVVNGRVALNGETLVAGDGAAISDEGSLRLEAAEESEVLLFDLA